jgi:hypothetical protein
VSTPRIIDQDDSLIISLMLQSTAQTPGFAVSLRSGFRGNEIELDV